MSPRARRQTHTATDMSPEPRPAVVTGAQTSSPQSRLERIAQRAYAIYERRGGDDGSSLDDWLQAEREIDSEA